jgi:hypothetical protein
MAIPAVNAIVTNVVFMAELDRLLLLKISASQVRGACHLRIDIKSKAAEQHHKNHADPCNVIRTLMKELCHV